MFQISHGILNIYPEIKISVSWLRFCLFALFCFTCSKWGGEAESSWTWNLNNWVFNTYSTGQSLFLLAFWVLGLAWTFCTALFWEKLLYPFCKIKIVEWENISCFTSKINMMGWTNFIKVNCFWMTESFRWLVCLKHSVAVIFLLGRWVRKW